MDNESGSFRVGPFDLSSVLISACCLSVSGGCCSWPFCDEIPRGSCFRAVCRAYDLQLSDVRDGVLYEASNLVVITGQFKVEFLDGLSLYFAAAGEVRSLRIRYLSPNCYQWSLVLAGSSCDVRPRALYGPVSRANTGKLDPPLMLEL